MGQAESSLHEGCDREKKKTLTEGLAHTKENFVVLSGSVKFN